MRLRTIGLSVVVLLAIGCGGNEASKPSPSKSDEAAPAKAAPAAKVGVDNVAATTKSEAATKAKADSKPVPTEASKPTVVEAKPEDARYQHPYAPPAEIQPNVGPRSGELKIDPRPADNRAAVLEWRMRLRAFEGAPPMIPHAVDRRTRDCRACHTSGATVGGTTAPQISRAHYQNCRQCHVERAPDIFKQGDTGGPPLAGTSFAAEPIVKAKRFSPGAPPMVPHPTWMREHCASCHGKGAPAALRTTHAERQSCTQCHVVDARSDQLATGSSLVR